MLFKELKLDKFKADVLQDDQTLIEEGYLISVNLSNYSINEIPKAVFTYFYRLERLNLSGNKLNTLQKHIFDPLVNLKELNLSGNKLQSLPSDLIRNLRLLETLNLDGNKLREFDKFFFEKSTELKQLSVASNKLRQIPNLTRCNRLVTLDFHSNKIEEITKEGLKGLLNLKEINLGYNKLTKLDLGDIPESILQLNLESNQLESIINEHVELLPLETLNLQSNHLISFPRFHLPSLTTLFLGENFITEIYDKSFKGIPELKIVFLQRNKINYIETNFICNSKLELLWLEGNELSEDQDRNLNSFEMIKNWCSKTQKQELSRKLVFELLKILKIEKKFAQVYSSDKTVILGDNIISLDLSGLGLSGILNLSDSKFNSISNLYVNDNHFDKISKLPNSIEILDLRNNSFVDLPLLTHELPLLKQLFLKGNPLPSNWDRNLTDEFDLEEFTLFFEQTRQTRMSIFQFLAIINSPEQYSRIITSPQTKIIQGKINSIDLSGLKLDKIHEIPLEISRDAKSLDLSNNSLSEVNLIQFNSLEELNLSRNNIKSINSISSSKSIKILTLSENLITEITAHDIKNFPMLESLDISDNELRSIDIAELTNSNLKELALSKNPSLKLQKEALRQLNIKIKVEID